MVIKRFIVSILFLFTASFQPAIGARSDYPVIFAHGMAGFDDLLGFDYWGNDYGLFVGNPQENTWLDAGQQSYAASVTPFHTSEKRGLELAEAIETYMTAVNAENVNIIAHSQGGLDARKAAKLLALRKGYPVVKVLCSISSPHRGSPVAKYVLDLGPGINSVISALAGIYGDVVYKPGNDPDASLKQLVYDDYDPYDGRATGAKLFNENYPISSVYASHYVSLITAQEGLSVNPVLFWLRELLYDIDGDGYCMDDCDNDGAAGCGDRDNNDVDDDGMVGINSQQMGYRIKYVETMGEFGAIEEDTHLGYVADINYPKKEQMESHSSVLQQDHFDVVGVGPDTFDEMDFYAALIEYIDRHENSITLFQHE